MKYFIIAGERSGDLHAGNLARALKRFDPDATMRGFGGEYMQSAGVDLAVHYRDIAVMGFWEVITSLRKISRYLNLCKQEIVAFQPDVIVLVDFGGFNKRIAAWAHERSIKVFYYISPKVWAWNQKRALKLKATVDRMFVILPFEKTFYRKFDWDVDYVGNPVLDAIKSHQRDDGFLQRHSIPTDAPLVALLPGSRKQEVEKVATAMADVVKSFPGVRFAVATVSNLDESTYTPLHAPNVIFVREDTYNLLSYSNAAVVTSGTATLETALLKVPQVVVYHTSALSYLIAKSLIRVPYISLVNLIADKPVVRELIQHDLTTENLVHELTGLLSGSKRDKMLQEYDEIYRLLDIGSASENAARKMVAYLKP
jgi:lipid-A-disaccharide synthase